MKDGRAMWSRVRYGSRRFHLWLRREGWRVKHQRGYRLYRLAGLSRRFKSRKARASHPRVARPMAQAPHEPWSLDLISDRVVDGRRFRAFT